MAMASTEAIVGDLVAMEEDARGMEKGKVDEMDESVEDGRCFRRWLVSGDRGDCAMVLRGEEVMISHDPHDPHDPHDSP